MQAAAEDVQRTSLLHHCCRYNAEWGFQRNHRLVFHSGLLHDNAALACHVPNHKPCPKPVALSHNVCSFHVVYQVQARCAGASVLCTPLCLPVLSHDLQLLVLCHLVVCRLLLQSANHLLSLLPAQQDNAVSEPGQLIRRL